MIKIDHDTTLENLTPAQIIETANLHRIVNLASNDEDFYEVNSYELVLICEAMDFYGSLYHVSGLTKWERENSLNFHFFTKGVSWTNNGNLISFDDALENRYVEFFLCEIEGVSDIEIELSE